MSALSVRGLVKRFASKGDSVAAVDGLSLEAATGELLTILGPSGCGKTTTLRCIAGLEKPEAGEIEVGGRILFSAKAGIAVPVADRGIGVVFQSYAIWPHMSVLENAAFPLTAAKRRRRLPRREIRGRVERVLEVVHLDHLAGRQATDLSGGEQQRLALARALVMEPPLLLLDEPLSNLDARLRDEMRVELRRLQREVGVTAVYVTHDQVEALALSDTLAVMNGGRLEQVGAPRDVYARPASRFVADFIGAANLLEGVVADVRDGTCRVATAHGLVETGSDAFASGAPVLLVVRPEHVALEALSPGADRDGGWVGTVEVISFLGDAADHHVRLGSTRLRVRTSAAAALSAGTAVALRIDGDSCAVVGAGG
jgi:iron(III) transport system ATP-binding protein